MSYLASPPLRQAIRNEKRHYAFYVFRYSKWNFSAIEGLKPYIDRDLSPVERLNPTPKEIQFSREWAGLMELRLALLRLLLPEGHRLPEELAEHLERQRARLEIYASGT
jgi:hypothetical protein